MNKVSKINEGLWRKILIEHILGDITFSINSKRELIAAQLLLAAIDIFAGLTRPREQENTTGDQFITWCDKHISLKGRNYELTSLDLWGARCGFLHGYTPISRIFNEGRAKMLAYVDDAEEDVMCDDPTSNLVIVSLNSLYKSLCTGLLGVLAEVRANPDLAAIVNERLEMMFYNKELDEKFKML